MFQITNKAGDMIKKFLSNQKVPGKSIRILMQTGWSGPVLGMALDEPGANDSILTEQGISFAIDKDLLEKAKPIRLDFVDSGGRPGFKFTSNLPTSSCGCS